VNAIIDEPSRDGDERIAIVRDAEKLSGPADNEVFKATHHVSEIIFSVRRVSDEAKNVTTTRRVKYTMQQSKHTHTAIVAHACMRTGNRLHIAGEITGL
jgi:hypothetical protein